MPSEPQTDLVTITLVSEHPVKNPIGTLPMRRFEIQAKRTTADPEGGSWNQHLSFQTLNQFAAALCDQAQKAGLVLKVTYRSTGYWDHDLLSVEKP